MLIEEAIGALLEVSVCVCASLIWPAHQGIQVRRVARDPHSGASGCDNQRREANSNEARMGCARGLWSGRCEG